MASSVQQNPPTEQSADPSPETSPELAAQDSAPVVELTPVKEAAARWGIKSAAFYERLKFLGLKATKQGRRSFLDAQQIALLDEFDAHIKANGTMEGFGALATAETAALEEMPSQAVEVETEAAAPASGDFEMLLRSAQEHAAGSLVAKYMLSAELQNRPDLLPEELRAQVETAQQNAAPKSQSPQAIAAGIMSQFRSGLSNPAQPPEQTPPTQQTAA